MLPAATRMGPVELIVTDLERTIAFYSDVIGLSLHRREDGRAAMGAGEEDLLVFLENPHARPAGRHAGLYHVALLFPSRLELARAGIRIAATHTPIQGASDHGTHEAIYLADPDGNGLELAADRPRDRWPDLSNPSLLTTGPEPLDLDGLLALASTEPFSPRAQSGLRVGHVHLHVADAAAALRFYSDAIGFETITDLTPSVAFVAAGGYHHHVAFNTWRGEGVPPAPSSAVGMRHFTVYVPTEEHLQAVRTRIATAGLEYEQNGEDLLVRDPSSNAVRIARDPGEPSAQVG